VEPVEGGQVADSGTRRNFAWQVLRPRGSTAVTGLLERPAPTVKAQPAGARVWLEVRFSARPQARRECPTGILRVVAAQTGDALATAAVGGFEL
jgi:hypothetical protein